MSIRSLLAGASCSAPSRFTPSTPDELSCFGPTVCARFGAGDPPGWRRSVGSRCTTFACLRPPARPSRRHRRGPEPCRARHSLSGSLRAATASDRRRGCLRSSAGAVPWRTLDVLAGSDQRPMARPPDHGDSWGQHRDSRCPTTSTYHASEPQAPLLRRRVPRDLRGRQALRPSGRDGLVRMPFGSVRSGRLSVVRRVLPRSERRVRVRPDGLRVRQHPEVSVVASDRWRRFGRRPPRLAVVLSGGANLGAFQVGVIDVLARAGAPTPGRYDAAFSAASAFHPGADAGAALARVWLRCVIRRAPDIPCSPAGLLRGALFADAIRSAPAHHPAARSSSRRHPRSTSSYGALEGTRRSDPQRAAGAAVLASAAIPGMFLPVEIDGSLRRRRPR
jgi:hypothetical protein